MAVSPELTVTTKKIAALVSGVATGWRVGLEAPAAAGVAIGGRLRWVAPRRSAGEQRDRLRCGNPRRASIVPTKFGLFASSWLRGPIEGYRRPSHARGRWRGGWSSQPRHRRGIEFAAKIFLQGGKEGWVVRRSVREQGHRRAELQVVRVAEDLSDRAALDLVHQRGALDEPWTEDRVRQIGACLGQGGNGEFARQLAGAEPRDLRKDEPHPMSPLSPVAQFDANPVVNRSLSIDKSLQIVRIAHLVSPEPDPAEGVSSTR